MNLKTVDETRRPAKYLLNALQPGSVVQLLADDGEAIWVTITGIERESKQITGKVELEVGNLMVGDEIIFKKYNIEVVA